MRPRHTVPLTAKEHAMPQTTPPPAGYPYLIAAERGIARALREPPLCRTCGLPVEPNAFGCACVAPELDRRTRPERRQRRHIRAIPTNAIQALSERLRAQKRIG